MGKTMMNDAIVNDNSRCMARDNERHINIIRENVDAALPEKARAGFRSLLRDADQVIGYPRG